MSISDDVHLLHRQVAEDLLAVGPSAPSGVDGWTAGDLAAHLLSQTGGARYALAVARLMLVGGLRLSERAGPSVNARSMEFSKRRGFDRAVTVIRAGPPWPLLRPAIAPIALLEIWVHGDDLRRANELGPSPEVTGLTEAVQFLQRYHRKLIGSATIPHASGPVLMRWLTGRPSPPLSPHDPPLRI